MRSESCDACAVLSTIPTRRHSSFYCGHSFSSSPRRDLPLFFMATPKLPFLHSDSTSGDLFRDIFTPVPLKNLPDTYSTQNLDRNQSNTLLDGTLTSLPVNTPPDNNSTKKVHLWQHYDYITITPTLSLILVKLLGRVVTGGYLDVPFLT